MAKLKPGVFGHPIGRIGNQVFYILNGQGLCRSIGVQDGEGTPKQKANRFEMKLMMELLKPLQGFIKQGFEHKAKGTVWNAFNLATSYNKQNAIQGEYPNLSINYTKVKLSSGTLPLAKDLQIIKSEGGLTIKWEGTHQWAGDQYDDLVMVALYHPSERKASVFLNAGKRELGECFVPIEDQTFLDEPIEAFLCFKSADGKNISDSVYLGNINGSHKEKIDIELKEEYLKAKVHFDGVEANFKEREAEYLKTGIGKKAVNMMRKEYLVFKNRLENLPGKPV